MPLFYPAVKLLTINPGHSICQLAVAAAKTPVSCERFGLVDGAPAVMGFLSGLLRVSISSENVSDRLQLSHRLFDVDTSDVLGDGSFPHALAPLLSDLCQVFGHAC